MQQEPIHSTRSEAVEWVRDNTGDLVFSDPATRTIVRVTASPQVLILVNDNNEYYWSDARQVV